MAVPAVLLAAVLAAGCTTEDEEAGDTTTTAEATTTVADAGEAETTTSTTAVDDAGDGDGDDAAGGEAGSGVIDVDVTLTDPDLGDSYRATQVVRNFAGPENARSERAEMVLVQFEVTAGTEFAGSVGPEGRIQLAGEDGIGTYPTTVAAAEMEAAGYTPFENVDAGESGTGWAAYYIEPKDSATLALTISRQEFEVLGSSDTIPALEESVPLIG